MCEESMAHVDCRTELHTATYIFLSHLHGASTGILQKEIAATHVTESANLTIAHHGPDIKLNVRPFL